MKNKLGDLDNHLFAALERLADETMTPEQIEAEATRAGAVVNLADKIIANNATKLAAARLYGQYGSAVLPMLPQIGAPKGDER